MSTIDIIIKLIVVQPQRHTLFTTVRNGVSSHT